jgi:Na+-driven multidrug efflux pump
MAAPMILSMLIGALYNVVDSLFVSHFSEDALTAVSLAFPIQNIIIAIGTGIGVGINSLLSKYLGEKKQNEVNKTAMNGIVLGLAFYVLLLLFGLFGVRAFYRIQNKDLAKM